MTPTDDTMGEVIHLPVKGARDRFAITGSLLEAVERELADKLNIAVDTSNDLMPELVDAAPDALNAFVRHHAGHFERRVIGGGDQMEVAAVLIRHAFVVGVFAERHVNRRGV